MVRIIVYALVLLVSGCTTVQYRVGEKTYSSRAEAMQVYQADLDNTLSGIVPVQSPVGGEAVLVLPSKQRLLDKGVVRWGKKSAVQDEIADYVAWTIAANFSTMAEAVKKARVYDQLTVSTSDDPAETAKTAGAHFVVWIEVIDPNTSQWYTKSVFNDAAVAVPPDMGVKPGTSRTQKWIQLLNDICLSEVPEKSAKPAAGLKDS